MRLGRRVSHNLQQSAQQWQSPLSGALALLWGGEDLDGVYFPMGGRVTREILEIKKHMTSNVGTLICLPAADNVFCPSPAGFNNNLAGGTSKIRSGGMAITVGWGMNVCRPSQ